MGFNSGLNGLILCKKVTAANQKKDRNKFFLRKFITLNVRYVS
jgi:hypothetical protein